MFSSFQRLFIRAASVLALTTALVVSTSASASAHVRVSASSTAPGSYSVLTFRVPTESDTASTTRLVVDLPTTNPFLYVSVQPVPGWTAEVSKATLPTPIQSEGATITEAPNRVTWTATAGSGIAPSQFQQFAISAGPLPKDGTVMLPATQTYSDGKVVNWNQPETAGQAEPEYPSPAVAVGTTTASTDAATDAATDESSSVLPTVLSGIAVLLSALALLVAIVRTRTRKGTVG